jgi:hypothetical protein
MIIVAIDPGANGAIAILNTYRFRETYAIPLAPNTLTDIYLFLSEIRGGEVYRRAQHITDISNTQNDISNPSRTSIKKVLPTLPYVMKPDDAEDNTMEFWLEEPGQIVINRLSNGKDSTGALLAGMTASRKLGRSIGQWEGIAAALNISVNLVPPKKWQSAIGSKAKGNKNILKKDAECIFNHLTGDNGKSRITLEIADSLLIAAYAYMQYADRQYWPSSLKSLLKANGTY